MIVSKLDPRPDSEVPFRLDQARFVPVVSGCYALTTARGVVLYVGLARNLRSRIAQHLETPVKTAPTADGRARMFHWVAREDVEMVERTWMNTHLVTEGRLPILNRVFSPVAC